MMAWIMLHIKYLIINKFKNQVLYIIHIEIQNASNKDNGFLKFIENIFLSILPNW